MQTAKNKIIYEKDICGFEGRAVSAVFPESIAELKSIAKLAKHDIVPRGTGMSFVGGCAPNNSIVIDMSRMNRIIEIDSARKIVYAEAGVMVCDLNLELEKYGLELPVTPLFGIQTIGGIIALNSAGDREMKYGRICNWINSLEVIDSRGELIEVSRADANDFAGMEGITGIIARAKLRLTAKKNRTLSILKSDSSDELAAVSKKLKMDHEVSLLVMMDKKLSLMCGLENKYHLFVEYEGSSGRMKGAFYTRFMQMKDNSCSLLFSHRFTILENPKFFAHNLDEFIAFLNLNSAPYLCNLGSGAVYAFFKPEETEKHAEALRLIRKFRARVSYNLGIGLAKKEFLDAGEQQLIRRIKLRHDPDWRFQRNKVIDYEGKDKGAEDVAGEKSDSNQDSDLPEQDKTPEQESIKTPDEEIHEFIEEERMKEILDAKPAEGNKGEISEKELPGAGKDE